MQVKDMYLKNDKIISIFLLILLFVFSKKVYSDVTDKTKIIEHLDSLKYFSASFIQSNGNDLSEGKVYIGDKRIRAEYFTPNKILIILDKDKAMYFNYELEEDEFFNPRNTSAWFFYDIFRNPFFFNEAVIKRGDKELIIERNGSDEDLGDYLIRVIFENSPLILRKIEVLINGDPLLLSIFNHKYNENFDKNFFKLINPTLLN